jgi:hypothetical protein
MTVRAYDISGPTTSDVDFNWMAFTR